MEEKEVRDEKERGVVVQELVEVLRNAGMVDVDVAIRNA